MNEIFRCANPVAFWRVGVVVLIGHPGVCRALGMRNGHYHVELSKRRDRDEIESWAD
ncbi:hypothetical protein ABT052_43985 [Streptomyces sp. NPDC002766]|uniref:hypothetical protein n=1 Tax=unclassified Streptomyces TaxID=2593676 RepID=UPI003330300C